MSKNSQSAGGRAARQSISSDTGGDNSAPQQMDDLLHDDLTSAVAQLNHINNRLMQIACRGHASRNLRRELGDHAKDLAHRLETLGLRS